MEKKKIILGWWDGEPMWRYRETWEILEREIIKNNKHKLRKLYDSTNTTPKENFKGDESKSVNHN